MENITSNVFMVKDFHYIVTTAKLWRGRWGMELSYSLLSSSFRHMATISKHLFPSVPVPYLDPGSNAVIFRHGFSLLHAMACCNDHGWHVVIRAIKRNHLERIKK